MNKYRSLSIPYNTTDQHDLEKARKSHLKKLSEIESLRSKRIDNISPSNYSECRRPGKKFRLNRKT